MSGESTVAAYATPKLEIEAFDPATGAVRIKVTPGEGNAIRSALATGCVHVYGTDDLAKAMRFIGGVSFDLAPYLKADTKGEADPVVALGSHTFIKINAAEWRLAVGGFGRGNARTKLRGATADFETLWGADAKIQYAAWDDGDFALWFGVGGAFRPGQDAYSRRGGSHRSESRVSDDGFVAYDFNYDSRDRRTVDLGYGELRFVAAPEWKATERFSVGARCGVAFDWMRARRRRSSDWAWTSRFTTAIPGVPTMVDDDADAGRIPIR